MLRAQIEYEKLHLQGKLTPEDYAHERKLFDDWARAETLVAESLAQWRAAQTAEASDRLATALAGVRPVLQTLLDFVGRFVNLQQISSNLKRG